MHRVLLQALPEWKNLLRGFTRGSKKTKWHYDTVVVMRGREKERRKAITISWYIINQCFTLHYNAYILLSLSLILFLLISHKNKFIYFTCKRGKTRNRSLRLVHFCMVRGLCDDAWEENSSIVWLSMEMFFFWFTFKRFLKYQKSKAVKSFGMN